MQELATSLLLAEEWEAHQVHRLAQQHRAQAADMKMDCADDADHLFIVGGAAVQSELDF